MADIYVARQQGAGGFDKLVALKFLREHAGEVSLREITLREMFLDELKTAALLNHPCIVQTFDAGEIDERLYMAMEFVNGETLSRFSRAVHRRVGSFPVELAAWIARDLANALEYAHTLTNLDGVRLDLVHRDVSPSNVLVSFDGAVKLLDFGIAKVATKLQPTASGVIKGKFAYMSPEQAGGDAIDARSDVYSLGIVLWQLLTGKPAFEADSNAVLLARVLDPKLEPPSRAGASSPEALDEIVMRALAPARDDRYASAGDFAAELSGFLVRTAPGFDGAKVMRAQMIECFPKRKERLARIIKGVDPDGSPMDIDMLGGSIRTPSPHVMFPSAPTAVSEDPRGVESGERPRGDSGVSSAEAGPPSRRRWSFALGMVVTAAVLGFVAYRVVVRGDARATQYDDDPAGARPAGVANEPAPAAVRSTDQAALAYVDEAERQLAAHRLDAARDLTARARAEGAADPAINIRVARLDERIADALLRTDVQRAIESKDRVAAREGAQRLVARNPADPSAAELLAAALALPQRRETTRTRVPAAKLPPKPASSAPGATQATATAPPTGVATRVPLPGPSRSPDARAVPDPGVGSAVARPAPTGSFDATPSLTSVEVGGPLPDSEIRSPVERVLSTFRECYRASAKAAGKTPAVRLKISFEIDEGRGARNVRVSGDTLGVAACVKDASSRIRTRVAPDVGTASVTIGVRFQPI